MVKYNKGPSPETISEAENVAKSIQRPGQTKEQTKLIAQGIQKGIEQYKKNHKSKARKLDKKLKSLENQRQSKNISEDKEDGMVVRSNTRFSFWLPWSLIILSWLYFGIVK